MAYERTKQFQVQYNKMKVDASECGIDKNWKEIFWSLFGM